MVVALAACGGGGPELWSKQPLETFEGTNDGVTFTIQLPKGMKKSTVESKYDVEFAYHAEVGGENRVFAPNVSVSKASKKETLDDAIRGERTVKAPTDVIFKEASADGTPVNQTYLAGPTITFIQLFRILVPMSR
jgi:hypothetical protein